MPFISLNKRYPVKCAALIRDLFPNSLVHYQKIASFFDSELTLIKDLEDLKCVFCLSV